MMRNLSFIRIIFLAALSSLCAIAQAQQSGVSAPKPETPGTGSITGRVVNENGEPLPNAVVSIGAAGRNTSNPGVATDREGNFQFESLDTNLQYYITAAMPAYTALPRNPAANQPTTYRAGDSVTLTLTKGGVITGRVTSGAGEPLVGIRVRAEMVVRSRNGRRLNGWAMERLTDDRGVYRIYGLAPGPYVVMAGGAGMSYSSSNVDPYDTDVPTFAPSSTRNTANEVNVRSGEEVSNIDIAYRGEQGRTISGIVNSPAGETERVSLSLTPVGESASWSGQRFPEMSGRAFSYVGLGDGDYDLYAYSYAKTREYGVSEIKRIRIRGADVTGIELTPQPMAAVAGRFVLEETNTPECTDKSRPAFDAMTVGGWHNDTDAAKEIPESVWSMGSPVKPDAQGNFLVRNLAAGEYYFYPRVPAKNWYVRAIEFAASPQKKPIDATRVWTNVRSGERLSGLAITLAPGGASFSGQFSVAERDQAVTRTLVYLVPVERERAENTLSYFGTPVSAEGKFAISNIAPGRYWIFVQTLGEDELPSVRIRFPHETETRAQLRRDAEAAKNQIEFKPCQNVADYKLKL